MLWTLPKVSRKGEREGDHLIFAAHFYLDTRYRENDSFAEKSRTLVSLLCLAACLPILNYVIKLKNMKIKKWHDISLQSSQIWKCSLMYLSTQHACHSHIQLTSHDLINLASAVNKTEMNWLTKLSMQVYHLSN